MKELLDALEKIIVEHRYKAFITCPEDCFCWDVEKFVVEQDRQLTPREPDGRQAAVIIGQATVPAAGYANR